MTGMKENREKCLVVAVSAAGELDIVALTVSADAVNCGVTTAAGTVWIDLKAMTVQPANCVVAMFLYGGRATEKCLSLFPALSPQVFATVTGGYRGGSATNTTENVTAAIPSLLASLDGARLESRKGTQWPYRARFGPPGLRP